MNQSDNRFYHEKTDGDPALSPDQPKELEDLRDWKSRTLYGLSILKLDLIGEELGITDADTVADKVLPWIQEAKIAHNLMQQAIVEYRRQNAAMTLALISILAVREKPIPSELEAGEMMRIARMALAV